MTNPCSQTCPNRSIDCHGACKEYLAFWAEHREKDKRRVSLSDVKDYRIRTYYRTQKGTARK